MNSTYPTSENDHVHNWDESHVSDKKKRFSFRSLVPNFITLFAICVGLTSILFAIDGKWSLAVLAICVAGFSDGLDGICARLLNSSSNFGAELDSLADVINFGVAPALLVYLWGMTQVNPVIGWGAALFFVICSVIRLATFNINNRQVNHTPAFAKKFFMGLPTTVASGMMALPLCISFQFDVTLFQDYPFLLSLWTILLACLMIVKFPMFSSKILVSKPPNSLVDMICVMGAFIACLFQYTWLTMIAMGALYLASLPFSFIVYHHELNKWKKSIASQ